MAGRTETKSGTLGRIATYHRTWRTFLGRLFVSETIAIGRRRGNSLYDASELYANPVG